MAARFMSIRLTSVLMVSALALAAVLALRNGVERVPDAAAAPSRAPTMINNAADMQLPDEHEALPPNHPPIGGASPSEDLQAPTEGSPAVVWRKPEVWQDAPSPSAMRLATYVAPGGVEISVSRAGGTAEANIQRWTAQFDDIKRESRAEQTVHGLHVITIDVTGTYVGGGMTPGAAARARSGWGMVGAIAESRGLPYFFKMTGPEAAIRAARPAFDRLVDSIAPVAGVTSL
jgi:hypothetical protein